ncbi:MAG: hypothetical protein ACJA1R_002331, partial [Flavobacteriales bacterium]
AISRRMAWYPHVDFTSIGGPKRSADAAQDQATKAA